jgi:nucleoside-diphosphate-sugar epimerase
VIRDRNELKQVVLDLDGDVTLPGQFDVVHYHVPPPRDGDVDPRIGRLLAALAPPSRLIYLSATSVYGDHGGAWVDEDTPAQPGSDRGRRRLDAEHQVRAYCSRNDVAAVSLRVAGIYGPCRSQRLQHDPHAALKPVNRIHVDDLAAIAFAAATRDDASGIYNCADSAPSMEPVSSYSNEAKKIRARRIERGLGVTLRYPVFVNDPE